ncbi:hypothetical protein G6F31_019940 [Rhizopus arrhizus]|nr:hypothetical protein G6F31_019940 [Rhizopus arrhizus]
MRTGRTPFRRLIGCCARTAPACWHGHPLPGRSKTQECSAPCSRWARRTGTDRMTSLRPGLPHRLPAFFRSHLESLSGVGLLLGTLFFAASLTPTLVPRTYLTQGVLAGTCLAAGYGLGVLWHWLWAYLELPAPKARAARITNALITVLTRSAP